MYVCFTLFYLNRYISYDYHDKVKLYFVWSFTSHSRFFHSFWDVTITGEGLRILTYARHSWPFISVPRAHLLLHRTSVYKCHLRGPVTLTTFADRLAVELSLSVRNDLGLLRLGFEHKAFRLRVNALTHHQTLLLLPTLDCNLSTVHFLFYKT